MPKDNPLEMNEDELENDIEISINISSPYALEQEIMSHPKKEAKYHIALSIINERLETALLEFEILVSELVKEVKDNAVRKGKPIPPSALSEIRRSVIPRSKRYKAKKEQIIGLQKKANMINGLVKAWMSRSYKLSDLAELMKRQLQDNHVIYGSTKLEDAEKKLDEYEKSCK